MTIIEVKAPQLSESVNEATMLTWNKGPGDKVEEGEVLVLIETDKVTLEVPAPAAGILGEIFKQNGDIVHSSETLATIGAVSASSRADRDASSPPTAFSEDAGSGEMREATPREKSDEAHSPAASDPNDLKLGCLSISIGGTWTARDFADFYGALSDLYLFFALVEIEQASLLDQELEYQSFLESYAPGAPGSRRNIYLGALLRGMPERKLHLLNADFLKDGEALLSADERLTVRRCIYASPGVSDVGGLGVALKEMNEFVRMMKDHPTEKKARQLANQGVSDQLERDRILFERSEEVHEQLLRTGDLESIKLADEIARRRREDQRAEELHQEDLRARRLENDAKERDNKAKAPGAPPEILYSARGLLGTVGITGVEARYCIATITPALTSFHRLVQSGQITGAQMVPAPTK